MPRRLPQPSDDVTVYLVLNDHGQFGIAFETDPAEADRETIIRNFLTGQYSNALRVVAFNTAEGWSRDVSEDIAGEVLERAFDADDNLGEDTKRFIDRHVRPGEKRPSAPSVRRATGADQPARAVGRPVRETKKSPSVARAFGARTRGGMGGTSFATATQTLVCSRLEAQIGHYSTTRVGLSATGRDTL
jgi:hypothetical protein